MVLEQAFSRSGSFLLYTVDLSQQFYVSQMLFFSAFGLLTIKKLPMIASFVKQAVPLYFSCFDSLGFHILGFPRIWSTPPGLWLTLGRCLHLCCVCGVAGR